ncbi:recombinase family protein [Streptacidiphilus sp. PAMC 29251]
MGTKRVGIYCRISNDKEGAGLGVKRQEADCRLMAAALGWTVIGVYVDNDVSAADRRKIRHEYQRLLSDIENGRIDAVISWHTDRLHRQPRELEDFIDLVEDMKIEINTVKAGILDITSPSGRMIARVHAAIAKHEVEHKRERVLSKVEELARQGKIHNGGHRPFGYTRIYEGEGPRRKVIRDEVNPEEAKIIRECARRALEGESLSTIVQSLHARDILTSTGRPWTLQAMRAMLRSGRIAGLKEHKRQVIGKAVWPGIVPQDQHDQLRALLDHPTRFSGGLRGVRKHPLSGLVRCTCSPHHPAMKIRTRTDTKRLAYACPARADGGCQSRTIDHDHLMNHMKALILAHVEKMEAAEEEDTDDPSAELEAKIANWEFRMGELTEAFADGDRNAREYRDATEALRSRIDGARFEIAKHGVRQRVEVTSAEMREAWDDWPLERKRTILVGLFQEILIHPATRPYSVFNPARIETVPR